MRYDEQGNPQCDGVTGTTRLCKRPARFVYYREGRATNGKPVDVPFRRYCKQHHDGGGRAALLRPAPWEYAFTYDLQTDIIEASSVARA